ncbi:MAG: homocysteine S-methyltransferase family protein [Bacteroidetes bacterium]|nr:homocysteine S-methyltransferase family protein [Bacteroidota bacterium]MBU2583821.1 homocysteine S-methyltransferase family protein [Bacteroidota bacterium]
MINQEYFLNLTQPLVLDGPIGTRLIEEGEKLNTPLWSAETLMTNPDLVQKIHKEYIQAGADIITTNTFRTNPYSISRSKINSESSTLVKIAVDIAKTSIKSSHRNNLILAGSNAPADDCYSTFRSCSYDELLRNHSQHISSLMENNVDFILNETFGDKEEIEIVSKFCYQNKIPFAVSILIRTESETYHGQNLRETLESILRYEPLFVSLNCARPKTILNAANLLQEFKPFGVYPNLGSVESFNTDKLVRDISVSKFTEFVNNMIETQAKVIGVCCGGKPDDISVIRHLIDKRMNENH